MTVEITTKGKTLYIQLKGELDHHNAVFLREKIDQAYERTDCKHLLFNFSEVTFMDSSGIGMVIGRYKSAEKRGGIVAIAAMRPEIQRIFQITGLAKIIRNYSTVEEAEIELNPRGATVTGV